MHKFLGLTALLLVLTPIAQGAVDLPTLLAIKPGSILNKDIPLEKSEENFDYTIEVNAREVKSVRIDFKSTQKATSLVNPKTQGFCLIQSPPASAGYERFYFFDTMKDLRYELTPGKEIKAILIQKIPGAKTNRPCTFESFEPHKALVPQIKKVK